MLIPSNSDLIERDQELEAWAADEGFVIMDPEQWTAAQAIEIILRRSSRSVPFAPIADVCSLHAARRNSVAPLFSRQCWRLARSCHSRPCARPLTCASHAVAMRHRGPTAGYASTPCCALTAPPCLAR